MKYYTQESNQSPFIISSQEATQIDLLAAFGDTHFCLDCGCTVSADHKHDNEEQEEENIAA